jgi:hypothetical protein
LFRGIVKTNAERVSGNDFERANSINRMTHETTIVAHQPQAPQLWGGPQ